MSIKPDHRRERIRRMNAKRPDVKVSVAYEACSQAHDQLLDLLLEMLDKQRKRDGA